MDPNPDDARRAVVALILGHTSGQCGSYHLHHNGNKLALRYPTIMSGWSMRVMDGVLYWWPAFRTFRGHRQALIALEELIGFRLEFSGPANFQYEVLGPLGLAALRAHLTTTVAT